MNGSLLLAYFCALFSVGSVATSALHWGSPHVGASNLRQNRTSGEGSKAHNEAERPPQRVLSASLLGDELLYEVLATKRWAGVSYVVDWPSSTPLAGKFPPSIPRTTGTSEDIIMKSPDLVIFSSYNNALTGAQIQELGIPLFVIPAARSFNELFEQWQQLGSRVGETQRTAARLASLRLDISEIKAIASRAYTASGGQRSALLMQGMYSYGSESLQGDCLEIAGLQNVVGQPHWGENPKLNVELLATLNPELIFVAGDTPYPRSASEEDLETAVPWRRLRAFRTKSIYLIPGSWMASISHHALKACLAYAELSAQGGLP